MSKFSSFVLGAAAAGALMAPMLANAHGIWFAERARQTALIYGVGSDDLDAVKRLPLIQSVVGYDSDWNAVPTSLREAGAIPVVDSEAPIAAVTAVLNNGVWSKDKEGEWHKKGRDELPDAALSERTMKYAVHLKGTLTAPLPALADQTLQIIPVGEIPLEKGESLTIRVLFEGKPLKGAEIKTDFVNDPDQKPLKTDAKGMAKIKVRNQGLNVIGVTHKGPSDQPEKYDLIEHFATLSFVLPHQPE